MQRIAARQHLHCRVIEREQRDRDSGEDGSKRGGVRFDHGSSRSGQGGLAPEQITRADYSARNSQPKISAAKAAPTNWAAINIGTSEGAMPANVSENARPMATAGLAKDVDAVNQ